MLRLSAGGPVCVNGRVVGALVSVSGVMYITWTGVIKMVRLWVALLRLLAGVSGVTYVTWTGVIKMVCL